MTSILVRAILAGLLATPLSAAPARHPSYEPIPPPATSSSANLLLKANATASGQWSDRAPGFAVDGRVDPQDIFRFAPIKLRHLRTTFRPRRLYLAAGPQARPPRR